MAAGPEELVGLDYAGTVTFNSDMTYTTNFVGISGGSYTVPPSCLPIGVTCADVFPNCTGGSICTCPAPGAYASIIAGAGAIAGSGTYSIAGDDLIFSPPKSSILGITYCVQNGFLHLETNATVMQSDGSNTTRVTSEIVAQVQLRVRAWSSNHPNTCPPGDASLLPADGGAVRRQPRPLPLGPPPRQPIRPRAGLLMGAAACRRSNNLGAETILDG